MKNILNALLSLTCLTVSANAASVETRISTRETYVGRPVVLQVTIQGASQYQEPDLPSIDGCDIRLAGTPQQMSQITIINGRRSESRSSTLQYIITPRREGTFTIPALTLEVDGKMVSTEPQRFVASKSETGDLMFVEIDGGKKQVFVGQPLDLTLKIWIKPFRDPKTGRFMSEGEMWETISASSSWGGFADRMNELAKNRQRPGGEEVLRDDGTGTEHSYYVYRIPATVYPKRPGKIDASDVQIVVDYPTEMGLSRSPLESSFADDFFGGHSPLSRMLDDDFFGSPFGNRRVPTRTRPIVGDVRVDATEVLPVPAAGRPDDYRGAVGRYQVVTQATPTTVDAGDPITLQIGIRGTGPMELVQAPPLERMTNLTKDFKVPDESLAGFVQDDVKIFSTTIRPRRAGIHEIPPIRFSFFNPDSEEYEAVASEPIAITVNESETLALDAIVDSTPNAALGETPAVTDQGLPDLTNHFGATVLTTQSARSETNWWWAFVIAPPILWLGIVVLKYGHAIRARMPSLRAPQAKCLAAIDQAGDTKEVKQALVVFILRRTGNRREILISENGEDSEVRATEAVGALRLSGLYHVASEVESFLSPSHSIKAPALQDVTEAAKMLVERVDSAIATNKLARVRRTKTNREVGSTKRSTEPLSLQSTTARLLVMLALTLTPLSITAAAERDADDLNLSPQQQSTLLSEATTAYEQGIATAETDSADAKQSLALARTKYQMLIDSGINNAELFTNLGNADLQTGRLGNAIASYEKALLIDPRNVQAKRNLAFANRKVEGETTNVRSAHPIARLNDKLTDFVGVESLIWTLVLSSVVFWGLMTIGIIQRRFPVYRWAALPLALLLISLGSVLLTQSNSRSPWNAVMVSDSVKLYAGDGEEFDAVVTLDTAQGHRVEVLGQRGAWSRIRTTQGHTGWVHDRDVELVSVT